MEKVIGGVYVYDNYNYEVYIVISKRKYKLITHVKFIILNGCDEIDEEYPYFHERSMYSERSTYIGSSRLLKLLYGIDTQIGE